MSNMIILFENKQFDDEKQALNEFAFCHYPLTIVVDGEKMTFFEFSALENFIKSKENL